MTDFARRRADNPVNPGQAFPLDAVRRSRLLKQQRMVERLDKMRRAAEGQVDRPMVSDLKDFLDNEKILELSRVGRGEPITSKNLYRQQWLPIIQNLVRKKAAGTYDPEKAVLLFEYLVESARKEQGYSPLGRATKLSLARDLRDNFEAEFSKGLYEKYIPKKYLRTARQASYTDRPRIVLRKIQNVPGSQDRTYEADVVSDKGAVIEKLTGIVFADQGLNDQLQHHASVRGHGLLRVQGTEGVPPFGSEAKSYRETHPESK